MATLLADTTPLRESAPFRRLWWGSGIAQIGHQMTVVAVGLEAYHLTGSTFAVGLVGLFELVPLIVFGLYGGALADRIDRRQASLWATTVMWLTTLGLVAHAALGLADVRVLYALVAAQAAAFAVNSPARGAIIPRLVRSELMPAANALSGALGNLSLTVGPMAGALLVAGPGFVAAYGVDAVLMIASLWAVWRLPAIPPEPGAGAGSDTMAGAAPLLTAAAAPRGWRMVGRAVIRANRSVADGFRYLATQPNVRMTFLVDMCAMIFASPRVFFPAVGVVYLGGGATTTGALTTGVAVGGILAAVFSGRLTTRPMHGRIIALAVAAWAVSILAFGLVLVWAGPHRPAETLWMPLALALATLAAAGASDTVSAMFRQSVLQTATPDHMRGRLQGVFIVVVAGGPRLGDALLGAGAVRFGEGWTAVGGAVVCLVALGLLLRANPRFLAYDARRPEA